MKWGSAAIATHNQSLGTTRYSPSPLPHSRPYHMPLLTRSRPHYVPLLHHYRPHHMPLLPHARPHHCFLTIAVSLCIVSLLLRHFVLSHYRCLTTAVLLPMSHYRCLTTAVSLPLSHYCCLSFYCLTAVVSLPAPGSDGEETKEHNNSLGEPAYLHMSGDTLLRSWYKYSCSHIAACSRTLILLLSYCCSHIAALVLLLSYCCSRTTALILLL